MILYLATKNNEHKLDSIVAEQNLLMNKHIIENQNFSDFISNELKNINTLDHLVLDFEGITDTENEYEEVIETLIYMYDAKVLLMIDDPGIPNTIEFKDNYTILNMAHRNVDEELIKFFDGELKIKVETIWIGVASIKGGCGVTTAAISLANFIKKYENSICYVEMNETEHLASLAEYYQFEKLDTGHYKYNNLIYRKETIDATVKYLVFDLGALNSTKMNIFNKCTVKILISDAKPYRLDIIDPCIEALLQETIKLNLFINFAPEEEKEKIRNRYVEIPGLRTEFLPYHTDLFNQDKAEEQFKPLLKDYLYIPEDKVVKVNKKKNKLRSAKRKVTASMVTLLLLISVGLNYMFINLMDKKDENTNSEGLVSEQENTEKIKEVVAQEITTQASTQVSTEVATQATADTTTQVATTQSATVVATTQAPSTVATTQTTTATTTQATTQAPATVAVTPTISLSGYNGQIYSGSNVRSIANKFAGQGISMSVLKRDNTTTGIEGVDNACSYLCQAGESSLLFIEQ